MNKEKQIEEMARFMCDNYDGEKGICGDGMECNHDCWAYREATHLYNAGYRKQSENVIELPCKVGDKVSVRAMCECVITTPCYEECRHICPFENDCESEECSSLNERIFDTTVSSIFNNGQGWYIEFKHLIPFARFTDIGTSFFVGENAHEQAEAYERGLAERSNNDKT